MIPPPPPQCASLPSPQWIGGVPVHPLTLAALLDWLTQAAHQRAARTVLYANAYAINLAQREPAFRAALQGADLVFCDGYGVWLAARWLGTPLPGRYTPPDWIEPWAARCATQGQRHFWLGARPGVAEAAAQRLRAQYPTLQIESHHGYFDTHGTENEALLARINRVAPDFLLVGMGMPRQEQWIAANRARLSVGAILAVGGLFDLLAGQVRRGPRWLTQAGGEWLWRLATEPRRLWRRYLLGNPAFLWLVLRQRWGQASPTRPPIGRC